MLIGGNFSPYRAPADGVPFYCATYNHAGADVLIAQYNISTQVPNFDATIGGTIAPYERFDSTADQCDESSCTFNGNCPPAANAVPFENWIGTDLTTATRQYTMVAGNSNSAPGSFSGPSGNINFAVCHKRGFKNVAARRGWHGTFEWTAHDPTGCNNTFCNTLENDIDGNAPPGPPYITTYSSRAFEPYQATPDQTKYLTCTVAASLSEFSLTGATSTQITASASGDVSVNSQSGERDSTLSTSQTNVLTNISTGVPTTISNITNGYDSVSNTFGNPTALDTTCGADVHCAGAPAGTFGTVDAGIGWFNNLIYNGHVEFEGAGLPGAAETITPLPPISNNDAYSATGTYYRAFSNTDDLGNPYMQFEQDQAIISWSRSGNVYTWSASYINTQNSSSNPTGIITFLSDQYSGSLTLSNLSTGADVYADIVSLLNEWNLADDSQYPWRVDGQTTIAPKVSRLEVAGNATPLMSYPGQVNDLSAPITDADGNAPFTVGWSPTYTLRGWFDTSVYQWQFNAGQSVSTQAAIGLVKFFDGSIQGAPNPAGHEGYFRFDFEDWRVCCADVAQWYRYGWGASVGGMLPQNATQWTNNFEMMNKPSSGALLAYNDDLTIDSPGGCAYSGTSDPAFWAVKWAECGETYQSYNFARPAGRDKFVIDETQPVYCYDGATLTNVADGSTAASVSGTGPWGGPSAGGWYNGFTSDGGGAVTFGTKLFTAPSDWNNNSDDAASAFGKLRFSSAPSLLGRVVIAPDVATGKTMTFGSVATPAPQTNFGMAAAGTEAVDLYDASMTALASNVTATRVSDTVFTVAASYPTAVFVMIHGAAAYKYCDDYPKGDFIYLEWLLDNRTNQEYTRLTGVDDCTGSQAARPTLNFGYASFSQTQDALPILKCSPRVACFSPNGEVFPNGKTYPFPSSFDLDERYGSKWQAQIIWSMTDPLWQTPHERCGLGGGPTIWGIDDGSCQPDIEDVNAYFGKPPMFEARLAVPSGFPAMPSGITLGFLSPVLFNSGDVAFPPGLTGYDGASGFPNAVATPWTLAIALCAALPCDQFGYADWVVGCQPATGD